jgi:hypothetical protein
MRIEAVNPIARYLLCSLDDVDVTWSTLSADTEAGTVELLVKDENGKIKKGVDGWPMYETRTGKVEIRLSDTAPAWARLMWLAELKAQESK